MFTIRTLSANDSLESVTSVLHRAYAEWKAMGLNYLAIDQSSAMTAKRIAGGHCLIAEWDQRIVGTVVVKPTDAASECEYFRQRGVATLRQFGVDPDYRGKGIGLRLVEACEDWARAQHFRELALDTATPAVRLVAFYSRLGFVPVATVQWPRRAYESVVMSKVLGDA